MPQIPIASGFNPRSPFDIGSDTCLPTVITTNLTIPELDGRLASRLTDPQVSTILLMGRFDFWGKDRTERPAQRGRSRSR